MHFEIVGTISKVETIAVNRGIRILQVLRKRYGAGRWRKLKGVPKCVWMMVRFAWLKCIGSRLTELAKGKSE